MKILAIDPGQTTHGYVHWRNGAVEKADSKIPTNELLNMLWCEWVTEADVVAIESMTPYTQGNKAIFISAGAKNQPKLDTLINTGRIIQVCEERYLNWLLVDRRDIKKHFGCNQRGSKDAQIRAEMINRMGWAGQSQPGRKYGVTSHAWAALAVAVWYTDTQADLAA